MTEVLIASGSGYNLIDLPTIRRLKIPIQKLPENVHLRTISGEKLPTVARAQILSIHENQTIILQFFITKHNLSYAIVGRQGMIILYPVVEK